MLHKILIAICMGLLMAVMIGFCFVMAHKEEDKTDKNLFYGIGAVMAIVTIIVLTGIFIS